MSQSLNYKLGKKCFGKWVLSEYTLSTHFLPSSWQLWMKNGGKTILIKAHKLGRHLWADSRNALYRSTAGELWEGQREDQKRHFLPPLFCASIHAQTARAGLGSCKCCRAFKPLTTDGYFVISHFVLGIQFFFFCYFMHKLSSHFIGLFGMGFYFSKIIEP